MILFHSISPRSLLQATAITLAVLCHAAVAQVCASPGSNAATTSIAGIVNSYYPGTGANVPINSTIVPVGAIDPAGNAAAIAPGDLLVVMQMQGAEINFTNSDCYGDGAGTAGCASRTVTAASYAGGNLASNYKAGAWEYCTATTAAGAAMGVVCGGPTGGTVNAYQASAAVVGTSTSAVGAYRYQVVRVPQYASVALTANVVPLAWNGSAGGLLALQASGTVTMAGFNLDASGRGFRGGGVTFLAPYGPPVLDPTNGSTYYAAPTGSLAAAPGGEREGSFKGEGIAGTPQLTYNGTTQTNSTIDGYPAGSRARGAPGNAGGGGNNQNGGGGGGGNGGAGGQGGGCWSDASRPTNIGDCGGFGGDGASRAGNNLLLGTARVVMGGGGGGGHVDGGGTNCQLGGWGGNGGGVVLVRAAALAGTGSILSNGSNGTGPNFTVGGCTDASGGAGAGGTLLVAASSGLVGRTLQASGGNGANSSYDRHGPGGGGGGGAIYYNTAGGAPTTVSLGGTNGVDAGNTPANPTFPGDGTADAWNSTPGAPFTSAATGAFTPACSTSLAVTKTNGVSTVLAGGSTSYTVTFTNLGATAADGAIAKDTPSAGLACTVLSCTASTVPTLAVCPAAGQWPNLFTAGGVALPTLPALSSVVFVVGCGVTATGQ
jgi:mucin-19